MSHEYGTRRRFQTGPANGISVIGLVGFTYATNERRKERAREHWVLVDALRVSDNVLQVLVEAGASFEYTCKPAELSEW